MHLGFWRYTRYFIHLAFGHLRLSGPYAFGNNTLDRAEVEARSSHSQCGRLPPDSFYQTSVDSYQTLGYLCGFVCGRGRLTRLLCTPFLRFDFPHEN